MEEIILLDTNILIEVLKNSKNMIDFLNRLDNDFSISSITMMELYFGALNKEEVKKLEKFFYKFDIVDIDEKISKKAVELIKKYAKSHNLNIPNALIAATAIEKDYRLFTLNLKDFRYIKNIKLLEV